MGTAYLIGLILSNWVSLMIGFAGGYYLSPTEIEEKTVYKTLYSNAEMSPMTIFGECAEGKIRNPVRVGDVSVVITDGEVTLDMSYKDNQSILLQPTLGREPTGFRYGIGMLVNPDDIKTTLLNYKDCTSLTKNYKDQAVRFNQMLEKLSKENNNTKALVDRKQQ